MLLPLLPLLPFVLAIAVLPLLLLLLDDDKKGSPVDVEEEEEVVVVVVEFPSKRRHTNIHGPDTATIFSAVPSSTRKFGWSGCE